MDAAADMKNQSMGLIRTNIVNAKAVESDFSDYDFSRANLTNADLTGATFRGVRGLDTAITTVARGLP